MKQIAVALIFFCIAIGASELRQRAKPSDKYSAVHDMCIYEDRGELLGMIHKDANGGCPPKMPTGNAPQSQSNPSRIIVTPLVSEI